MMDVEEQLRLRSRVRTRRHRNRSSDDVRAVRRQADRERKRAARQQATDHCVYHVSLRARPHLRMRISSNIHESTKVATITLLKASCLTLEINVI